MTKRLKHNLKVITIYSIVVYVLLIPLNLWIVGIGISLLIGWFLSMLNSIITELRILNGEKFNSIKDENITLLKS